MRKTYQYTLRLYIYEQEVVHKEKSDDKIETTVNTLEKNLIEENFSHVERFS